MIGWYVHHHGSGHLHRALAVRERLATPVTVLSSLERPREWDGPWVQVERDDGGAAATAQPDAGGSLHWAPLHHRGLRTRMAQISAWIGSAAPDLMVCDVSVEVSLLARLHGVPVAVVAMPGERTDVPHGLGYDIAEAVIGCWPPEAPGIFRGTPAAARKVQAVGGLSRFAPRETGRRRPGGPRVTVMLGSGGHSLTAALLQRTRDETPEWTWTVLDRELGEWRSDPYEALCDADVVVTHAGQNAVAEVASARRPAIVIPGERPFGEQHWTAGALTAGGWPVVVRRTWAAEGWDALLRRAAALDGAAWGSWCDGLAPARFAAVVEGLVSSGGDGAGELQ